MTDDLREHVLDMVGDASFTYASRREMAIAVAAMVAEECARECDRIEDDKWGSYKGRPPHKADGPMRANPHVQGESCGANECAAAIRQRAEGLK